MRKNNRSFDGTRVFARFRSSLQTCPSCKRTMLRMVKVLDGNIKTQNFIYICGNPKCSQKSNINQFKKAGWKLIKK